MSDSFVTPWTVAHQASLSMGFPRQEFWSGLPFPSPGDLPDPGIKPASPALAGGFFTTEPPGKPSKGCRIIIISLDYNATVYRGVCEMMPLGVSGKPAENECCLIRVLRGEWENTGQKRGERTFQAAGGVCRVRRCGHAPRVWELTEICFELRTGYIHVTENETN